MNVGYYKLWKLLPFSFGSLLPVVFVVNLVITSDAILFEKQKSCQVNWEQDKLFIIWFTLSSLISSVRNTIFSSKTTRKTKRNQELHASPQGSIEISWSYSKCVGELNILFV